jgi:polar amino acid transport system substrate-binding protein
MKPRNFLYLAAGLPVVGLSTAALGQTAPASEIAPGGKLRVGMIAITVLGSVAEPGARF